eukprot:gene9829-9988_t
MSKYSCCSDVPFEFVVRFMAKCSEVPSKKKEAVLVDFFKRCVPRPSPDIIQIFRLLLPAEDLDRRVYGLKEEKLAVLLVDAAGLTKTSPDAQKALRWYVQMTV